MNEIGSEFWLTDELDGFCFENISENNYDDIPDWLKFGNDNKLLLSGRTAIDFVLKDILKNKKVKTVYFPSYCCQSMIQPFVDNNIKIKFYEVYYDGYRLNYNIDLNQQCDIFFAINYFGFTQGRMDEYINFFKKRNVIVIEDSTHSLLSNKSFNSKSDYVVCSLRKWFPILSGGLAVKIKGEFNIKQKEETLEKMINLKRRAMVEKGMYIDGNNSVPKELFLKKYNTANKMLSKGYSLYRIDKVSYKILQKINIDYVKKCRIENSLYLYEALQKKQWLELMFPDFKTGDCPIFVPILIEKGKRNIIRESLIKRNIYCPVHWPKPSNLSENVNSDIYDLELSLINDQRYKIINMKYQIRGLEQVYEEHKV